MPIIDKHILGVDIGGTKTAIIYAQEKNGMEIKNKISFQTVKVWDTTSIDDNGKEHTNVRILECLFCNSPASSCFSQTRPYFLASSPL